LDRLAKAEGRKRSDVVQEALREFRTALDREGRFPTELASVNEKVVRACAVIAPEARLDAPLCRDPVDDAILASARAANADCLVTGDKDLLDLGDRFPIRTVTPGGFYAFEAKRRGRRRRGKTRSAARSATEVAP
jgi:predicted nucleic acid-binding protein